MNRLSINKAKCLALFFCSVVITACGGNQHSTSKDVFLSSSSLNSSTNSTVGSIEATESSSLSNPPSFSSSSNLSSSSSLSSTSSSVGTLSYSTPCGVLNSSISASAQNSPPEAETTIETQGLTVHINACVSSDAENAPLNYTIDYGDGSQINYGDAWHTYAEAGTYSIRVSVSDGKAITETVNVVTVQNTESNHTPVAKLTAFCTCWGRVKPYDSCQLAFYNKSYDADKDSLTYHWDISGGATIESINWEKYQTPNQSLFFKTFEPLPAPTGPTPWKDRLITLTVSDGRVSDSTQIGGSCNTPNSMWDASPRPSFTYKVDGLTVYLDARSSADTFSIKWDFGDGESEAGFWLNSHTYNRPGTYSITLRATEPTAYISNPTTTQAITLQ